jgi:hypothetical protein
MQPRKRRSRPIFQVTNNGLKKGKISGCCVAREINLRADLQRGIDDAQMIWLNVTIQPVQLFVQDIETKESHFGIYYARFRVKIDSVTVAVVLQLLTLLLLRRVTILV